MAKVGEAEGRPSLTWTEDDFSRYQAAGPQRSRRQHGRRSTAPGARGGLLP